MKPENTDRPGEHWSLPPLLGETDSPEIHEIHRSILQRERLEPQEGAEPAPWWVWAVSVAVLFCMGIYLGRYGGSFKPVAHELEMGSAGAASTASARPAPNGADIFSAICITCHQAGGTGIEGKYPPLAGSEWIAKDAGIPVRIVLNGLEGPIQVKGKQFVNQMPSIGAQLEDDEIAAVLSFVRSSWGNSSGKVPTELVTKLRRETAGQGAWTADKLNAIGGKP